MSSLLLTKTGQDIPSITEPEMKNYAGQIKKHVIELFEKNRSLQPVEHRRHTWGISNPKDIIMGGTVYGPSEIFPGHSGLKLIEETSPDLIKHYTKLNENARELIRVSKL